MTLVDPREVLGGNNGRAGPIPLREGHPQGEVHVRELFLLDRHIIPLKGRTLWHPPTRRLVLLFINLDMHRTIESGQLEQKLSRVFRPGQPPGIQCVHGAHQLRGVRRALQKRKKVPLKTVSELLNPRGLIFPTLAFHRRSTIPRIKQQIALRRMFIYHHQDPRMV